MARFLVSTAPLPGHLDWGGLLQTMQLLRTQGHEVLWLSGAAVSHQITLAGIPFQEVPVAFYPPSQTLPPASTHEQLYAYEVIRTLETWIRCKAVAAATDAHIRTIVAWQPDLIIADPLVLAAALASERFDIPLAVCGYPGPFMVLHTSPTTEPIIHEWYRRLNWLRQRIGLPTVPIAPHPSFPFDSQHLHLVFFTHDWFDLYNPRPSPGARFVGGVFCAPRTPAPTWLAELPSERPCIVVTQSTTYGPPTAQLPQIIAAIQAVGGFGIVIAPSHKRVHCEPLPSTIRWETWVEYAHLLPRADVIVHHGGMGTTHAALCAAVPQIVTPAAADQFLHADGVMRYGVGLAIPLHAARTDVFAAALHEVISETKYRTRAAFAQHAFAMLGGIEQAAALLTMSVCKAV